MRSIQIGRDDNVYTDTFTVYHAAKAITFHLNSLWLFTSSDLKTILGPSFIFGATNALAGDIYGLRPLTYSLNGVNAQRLSLVLLWIWVNLLPFTINNQKHPSAIAEDALNKPWRTLPSQRMTPRQAQYLMLILYPLAVCGSLWIGGFRQSAALVILGVWYNNFAGADANCLVRNLINALGYLCFTSGAMEVALGFSLPAKTRLVQWFGVIAAIVFSTIHLQDMYDQVGDRMRGRKTVPLVIGDGLARWTIVVPMLFWGYLCPHLWSAGSYLSSSSIVLAATVAIRSLLLRTVESDRLTFKIFTTWVTLVFVMPFFSRWAS